ncbi:acyl-CoA dehydrogenase family protein [Desulfosudis oleivorans]|uniref:Acyl-CoA dehydrogenase n=1 Tax=Desulfosudis oleivorans (strain DSM 6200 / JCM 39069 / Hxd3) TaxID=96561 RepID=A8ZZR0_DESOH|nr:acyl-CoA dehydrogenase family protein [Desulfosudis oleivorans]ABW68932.1 hypothetical protein Dole_3129 [Desulfosudis oleivorans Hxd3]
MKNALATIHDTYLERCDNSGLQKKTWRDTIAVAFPPDLGDGRTTRPSTRLAGEGGDLGCALLWIVQSALVRPFLSLIRLQADLTPDQTSLLSTFGQTDCGAMAHSEPKEAPVVLTTETVGFRLNGIKKYITAGSQADFILMSARGPGEEKVSRLLLLPVSALSAQEIIPLDLEALRTTSHGRLTLVDKTVPGHYLLPLTPPMVRKGLKLNGLVERSLIMEAVLAFMLYLNRRLGRQLSYAPADEATIKKLAGQQTEFTTAVICQARSGAQVCPQWVDLHTVSTGIESICNAAADLDPDTNTDLAKRINDLRFIRSLWG